MGRSRQYAERANILKKIQLGQDWKFAPTVERNGKIVRDHVWVSGRDEHHPEGSYYLEWYQAGRRRRLSVGRFDAALDAARRKSLEIQAVRAGIVQSQEQPAAAEERLAIGAAIDSYLDFIEHQRSPRTYLTYRYTLDTLLRESYAKPYVDQAERDDVLKFMTACHKRGLGSRTVYDKLVVVLQFFKRHGKIKLIGPSDWPEYVEKIRSIYEPEEIGALLCHALHDEAIFIKFMVASGFRDREERFLTWRDIDLRNCVARVTAKPAWGFRPKNWEERVVPLPSSLMEQLGEMRERRNARPADLVFPNSKGNPDSANDMIVKRVAQRAGLNCGQCITKHGNKCAEGPHCQHFFLHKFRHTFATEHLRHGIDIRTLQTWMGHRDIKSTMVYLKGVQSKDALVKVNAGALAAYVAQPTAEFVGSESHEGRSPWAGVSAGPSNGNPGFGT
jgi:integrase/recombinase XerD